MQWQLTDLAEDAINGLAAEGITPTPQDVLTLQQLSLRVNSVDELVLADAAEVDIGGERLAPLTIAGATFVDRLEEDFKGIKRFWLYAYAMRFGRDRERMTAPNKIAKREIYIWNAHLPCNMRNLQEAVYFLNGEIIPHFGKDEAQEEESAAQELAALVQNAVARLGGSPEMWTYQCQQAFVAQAVRTAIEADCRRNGIEPKQNNAEALRQLGLAVESIRQRELNK